MIEASKSTGKKKMRKGRRKKLLAPIKKDGLEEVSELTHFSSVSAHKPVLGSPKKSKSAGKLDERGHHPELEEDDDRDNFSAMNPVHESPLKPVTPGSRRAMQGPPRTSPRAGRTYKEPEASVVSSSLESQKPLVIKKGDASFTRAIESIAALKLHNYAMRRRQHI
eukprot:gene19686-14296_t